MTQVASPAWRGDLLPSHFAAGALHRQFAGRLGESTRASAARRFARWWRLAETRVGPATAVRSLAETCAAPMFAIFDLRLTALTYDATHRHARGAVLTRRGRRVPVLLAGWGDDLDRCWRDAVRHGLDMAARWTLSWNARQLRIVDSGRPWGRRDVTFDLARCATDADAFSVLWGLCRGDTLDARRHDHRAEAPALLDEILEAASRERELVRGGLERGVTDAVLQLADAFLDGPRGRPLAPGDALLDQALTVVYRLLFLLFAEARSLVPMWHRTYRDAYSIEALRESLERTPATPGLWAAIQAISRLAHQGCRVGPLRVTPFNGHLFAPSRAPLAERARVPDATLRKVLQAVTTARVGARPLRIAFADLGVEQLGTIYEHVLDHRLVVTPAAETGSRPPAAARPRVRLAGDRSDRKRSATFYTPRPLAHLIVRRALGPLVASLRAEEILKLRVVDPAMGSGAFLVAACGFLAAAYEAALVVEQGLRDHELDERDRAGFRRLVARRCLYGVDRNPMAVQLARLSLWLATLAADVPLTFLDHHLRVGDSLVGASLGDLMRQAPGPSRSHGSPRAPALPLLASGDALDAMTSSLPARQRLADLADDTIDDVRMKERLLESLEARGAPLARWRDAADLWCSHWFWPDRNAAPRGALYADLLAATLTRQPALGAADLASRLATVKAVAGDRRFFHWPFEFPEVFQPGEGQSDTGFDAVVGNPPWDMIRNDPETAGERPRVADHRGLAGFVRDAGIYDGSLDAHGNLYLLFLERALQLARHGGRLGVVVPWGLLGDHGASRVRRLVLDRAEVDACLAIDNRQALFPIHRSLRFVVLTATRGPATRALPLQHVAGHAAALDACGDRPDAAATVTIPRDLLRRLSPDGLAVPDVRSVAELALLEHVFHHHPPLADATGWNVTFGRELNATDDRALFHDAPPGLRVLEGKYVEPFRLRAIDGGRFVREAEAHSKLGREPYRSARVGYRDVASPTNQRTLIAAVVPAGAVTTHTLFCCRRALDHDRTYALCALLNSFVANWIVRRWVSTHVTVALVGRLPVPSPAVLGSALERFAGGAHRLSALPAGSREAAQIEADLQALAGRVWGLSDAAFQLVLEDFPLIDASLRAATLTAWFATARLT